MAPSTSSSLASQASLKANYQTGTANYLQVMVTDIQYHQAEINYLQAQAQQLQDTTALYVALGGGWTNDQIEKEKSNIALQR